MPNRNQLRRLFNSFAGWIHTGNWRVSGASLLSGPPSSGSDLVANGSFTSDTTSWTANTASLASVAGGQSGNALEVTNSGGTGTAQQLLTTVLDAWYLVEFYSKPVTAFGRIQLGTSSLGNQIYTSGALNVTGWTRYRVAFRAPGTSVYLQFNLTSSTNGLIADFDEVSVKAYTLADLFCVRPGVVNPAFVRARGTIAAGCPAGVVYGLDDPTNPANFILAVHDGNATATLYKCVAGALTSLIATSATYASGQIPEVRWTGGTTYQLWYNGAQVGADQSISDAGTGAYHGAFGMTGHVIQNVQIGIY